MCFRVLRRTFTAFILVALTWSLAGIAVASSPEAGDKGNYRGECRRLTKQIEHYNGTILPMAIERGNRGWEASTMAQVDRLWNRRADLCPIYGAERSFLAKAADDARKFQQLVAAAGRAAAAYFTGGLTGGGLVP